MYIVLRNLVREVFVAKALKHENLVALRGIALIPPEFCIVSEYCSQGTLVQSFNMPWRIRLELLLHAVKGIAYLHHRGKSYLLSTHLTTCD